jgi:hypothetical protein
MQLITAKRFLARNLFDGKRMQPLQLVDLTGETLCVSNFDRETAGTVFIDGCVVLLLSTAEQTTYATTGDLTASVRAIEL